MTGTVTRASPTTLIVNVSGLSCLTAGTALDASVSVDGVSSGSLVQVATLAPVTTASPIPLAANATSLTMSGYGFDSNPANDSVTFDNNVTGTVTSASLTSLTISVNGLSRLTAGMALKASVTVDDVRSSLIQVATMAPVVNWNTANLADNGTSLTIIGYGFDTIQANDSVTFGNGVTGMVTSASLTSLTVSVSGSSSLTAGMALAASVTVDGVSSGSLVQVATMAPVVTWNTANLAADGTTLTITGYGFDTVIANDSVILGNGVTGTVTSASLTSLTVSVSDLSSLTAGIALEASVTVDGISSGSLVQVATLAPAVTASTANLPGNVSTLTISGYGYDVDSAHDIVTFDNGVAGTVTNASLNSLTVSVSGLSSLTAGTALDTSVTVDGVNSGSVVQVATIAPVVTANTANLVTNAASLTISGYGFDTNVTHDTVTFSNGVTGTVTSASLTSLTVGVSSLSSLTISTTLEACVIVDGVSSGSLIPVAYIGPVVASNTANLAANATSLIISGYGFDTVQANDSVIFDNGVIGTVTSASLTSLTVSVTGLSRFTAGMALAASVTVDGVNSGSLVPVATLAPVVTLGTANLPANGTNLTINGYSFDTIQGNDSVTFDNGVIGTVTSASLTSLTVSVSGLNNLTAGAALEAWVTVDGVSSGNIVQVATMAPAITVSTANLPGNATTLTISGYGFDVNSARNSVTFDNGVTGTVTSAGLTSLTVSISGLSSLTAGMALEASVAVNGVSNGSAVQVATLTPVVTASTANLAANATALTISGYGFDSNPANDSVTFDNDVTGTVTSASLTNLTVSVSGLSTLTADTVLEASVTVDRVSNGSPVQVAALTPVVTASTANLAANATALTISGFGFDSNPANDSVTFDNDVTGTVTSASLTSLTVSISGLSSLTAGTVLEASVTVDLVSNGSLVQVATITPVVTLSLAYLPANATALTINGNGFDTNAANDSVTFDNHVTGIVTSASLTSLTVSLINLSSLRASTVLNASVTVDGITGVSVNAVPVGTIAPVVTLSTANLPVNVTALTICGYGFDSNPANDSVTFDNDVTGTVTSASLNSLTLGVSGLSTLTVGTVLEVCVMLDGVSTASPVPVATMVPVITASTANLAANANSLTMNGYGFDSDPANDCVTFDNDVTGTVTSASPTRLTVSVSNLSSLTSNTLLDASVTVDGVSNGSLVQVATLALGLSPVTLPNATANQVYNATISADGGSGSYSFALAQDDALPPGLTLSPGGVLGGTPTTAGNYPFTLIATDNNQSGLSGAQQYTLTVNPANTITLDPTTQAGGAVGSNYGPVTLSATGGSGAYTFAVAKGSQLPAGLSLSPGGVLGGTPTTVGTFSITVTATDNNNHSLTGSLKYSWKVNPALAIGPAALATVTVGNKFRTQLIGTGGSGKGYTFTASDLPSWLTLSPTGLLSGTPTTNAGAPLKFTVAVADSNGAVGTKNYILTLDPALGINPATLGVPTVGNKFSRQLTAKGGSGKGYTFTAIGLPSWLKITTPAFSAVRPPRLSPRR